jgi:hypothetical protein
LFILFLFLLNSLFFYGFFIFIEGGRLLVEELLFFNLEQLRGLIVGNFGHPRGSLHHPFGYLGFEADGLFGTINFLVLSDNHAFGHDFSSLFAAAVF